MLRDRRPARRAWARVRRAVLARDGWRCSKCGAAAVLEVHHAVPVSAGGGHDFENLVALCRGCHVALHRRERLGAERADWRAWLAVLARS